MSSGKTAGEARRAVYNRPRNGAPLWPAWRARRRVGLPRRCG